MCVGVAATALTSCVDTIILPDDITVGEDLWKKKSDVAMMVNSAYQGMTTENVMERLIVWSGVRSDELVQASSPEGAIPNALAELIAASTQVTNRYATWADFYSVINRCNIVLDKAEGVLSEDPNYTEGDYLTDRSQMLALRSLCYFYLVRNFRDIPYVDNAFVSSSQDRDFVQSSPAEVIDKCIESLEEAAANAIQARSYGIDDWRRVGWFTEDGINALLADVYLWRASVMHSDADYQKTVDLCTKVIESKKEQQSVGRGQTTLKDYALADAKQMFSDLFVGQNAEESIFELQLNANPALCKYLYKYGDNKSTEGYLKASAVFTKDDAVTTAVDAIEEKVFSINDIRYYGSIYKPLTGAESFDVRKMIAVTGQSNLTQQDRQTSRAYADIDQNYIVYRLSDVILMKAEAMVQLVDTVTAGLTEEEKTAKTTTINTQLEDAFNLVKVVNARAFLEANQADALVWTNLKKERKDKTGMELLVLEERMRELCFEGKRWYDLLRYNYRHMTGVSYSTLMADQGLEALPANYAEMLNIATRSRGTQKAGLIAKMRNEAYLYLPIPNSDQILATGLKQNPAYGSTNEFERK